MNSIVPSLERYRRKCYKKKNYSFSLSSFMSFFLLSLPFFFFLSPPLPSSFVTLSSFCLLLSSLESSPLHFIFTFFPFFCHFLYASLSLFFSQSCSLSLSFFFFLHLDRCHWDRLEVRPHRWGRLVKIACNFVCLFFFSRLWISCDYGWWWSWVDSMWFGLYKWNWFISHFFFLGDFCVDFGIFLSSIGWW